MIIKKYIIFKKVIGLARQAYIPRTCGLGRVHVILLPRSIEFLTRSIGYQTILHFILLPRSI